LQSVEFSNSADDVYSQSRADSDKTRITALVPVIYKSQYNILFPAYNTLHGTLLQNTEEHVSPYQLKNYRHLTLLTKISTRVATYGKECFRRAAVTLLNNPSMNTSKCETLYSLKKKIKPYLSQSRRVFFTDSIDCNAFFVVVLFL
jgi:hypothetical protein